MRVTKTQIENTINYLNNITNQPTKPYVDGKASIGNYHLNEANGGYALYRMCNENGGIREIIPRCTKKELLFALDAYIAGIQDN